MNLLFFLTPKQDVLYIYEDFTLRQTLEKWSNQRYATIPVLKRNGEYVGSITEGDILWGMKNLHGLDLEASEDVPISSFPRRRDRSLCVEDLRHILVEVHAVAVQGSVLREGQGARGHLFQRIPQQGAKHVTVVDHILRR